MSDLENKMNSAVTHFEKELNSLRTSRANPSMLDNIFVEAYGAKTPLNQFKMLLQNLILELILKLMVK